LGVENSTRLTDAALAFVGRMEKLRTLTAGGTFTDQGLEYCAGSRSLQHLTLMTDGVSDRAVSQLRNQMTVQIYSSKK
jgi:hypothetical protein